MDYAALMQISYCVYDWADNFSGLVLCVNNFLSDLIIELSS